MATDDLIVELDPAKVQEIYNPFESLVWDIHKPVTKEEIETLVQKGDVAAPEVAPMSRLMHMRKIAWFVVNGWRYPIDVDIGIPSMGYRPSWGITDGNHRFVAALVRGDQAISASFSGQVSEIARLAPG